MDFVLLTIGLLVVLFGIMVLLARAFEGHSSRDLLDWKPTRSPEVEAQNEIDDVQQMIDAQNEYRRKRGAKAITEADVQRQAMEDQALRARGSGPFAQQKGEVLDELDLLPPEKPKPKAKKKPPAKRKPAAKTRPAAKKKPAGRRNPASKKKA